jgi:hypothetical protein
VICFANEISIEQLLRIAGFTYVFENGKKCSSPLMSMFFSFYMSDDVSMRSVFFVNGISFENVF